MKRGAIQKSKAKGVLVFFPLDIMPVIDAAVIKEDTDRSKYIRNAVREKLGIRPKPEAA